MAKKRTERLNSLLKEVISDVIKKQVRNPHINELLTITRVDITSDLHYAKVYVGILGNEEVQRQTIDALQSAAGFIAVNASKQVVMRYFPALTFKFDDSAEKHMRIEMMLQKLSDERHQREPGHDENANESEDSEQNESELNKSDPELEHS